MVGMVFQDADSQIVGETVREDVAFGPENLGLDTATVDRRTDRALEKVGLSHKAEMSPHLLSGGEKRRLAIAGVLSMQPEIILFDEPFSNMDYAGICQVVNQMKTLKKDGHTIVVTSHDMDPVVGLADRLVILEKGRIVRDGKPALEDHEAVLFGIRPLMTRKSDNGGLVASRKRVERDFMM
jgi:biotin transport system ATP-binding protein